MWFEEIEVGEKRVLGTHEFTEDEIVEFAIKYDPQPFHIDAEAAKASQYGGLIASGWHTASMWMRLAVQSRMAEGGSKTRPGVSPGFEDLRWLKPVRPGTALTYTMETVEKIELKSRPAFGLVKSRCEARDGTGALFMSFIAKGFVPRKPHGDTQ
jgi:acyl dehydratase